MWRIKSVSNGLWINFSIVTKTFDSRPRIDGRFCRGVCVEDRIQFTFVSQFFYCFKSPSNGCWKKIAWAYWNVCIFMDGATSYKTKCLLIAFYLKFSHSLSRRIAEEWFSSGERFIRDRLENKNQYQSLFQTFYTAFVGALHSIFHRLCIVYNFILTQPLLSFPHMCGLCYYWLSVWIVRIYILLYSFRSIQSNRGNTCDKYTSDINHNEIENHFMRRKRIVLNCK